MLLCPRVLRRFGDRRPTWRISLFVAIAIAMTPVIGTSEEPKESQDPEVEQSDGEQSESDQAKPEPSKPDSETEKKPDDYYELFDLFVDSLDQIERNYVKEVDRRELIEAAIRGMVGKLDPHSTFIDPDDVDRFRSGVENRFGGIGIHITLEKGKLIIVSPLVGTPAYDKGVLAGDAIIDIDGESTDGITLDEAVRKLKGKVGDKVTVTLQSSPGAKPRTVTITRAMVRVETVLGDHRTEDDAWVFLRDPEENIAYIRVNSFGRDTARDLRKVLKKLKAEGLRGLVLDLRFNPGGLLTSAIEISDLFVSDGRIVSTKGRNTKERVWDAEVDGTFEGFPMAVLINRFSASASEIVSACLQDHDRAVVIGERSFGKGSVQNVIDLEDGRSVLKLTTAGYRRPSGKNIHRFPDAKKTDEWGVTPDDGYVIKLDRKELGRLMEYRREQRIAHGKSKLPASDTPKPVADEGDPAKETPPDSPPKEDAKSPDGEGDTSNPADESSNDEPEAPGQGDTDMGDGDKEDGGEGEGDQAAEAKADEKPFVDRQLKKALDYLSSEIAREE